MKKKISIENLTVKSFVILISDKERKTINGGAINAYIKEVQGEKQGKIKFSILS